MWTQRDELDQLEQLARVVLQVGLTVGAAAAGLLAAYDVSSYAPSLLISGGGGLASAICAGFALDIRPARGEEAEVQKTKGFRARLGLALLVLSVEVGAGVAIAISLS